VLDISKHLRRIGFSEIPKYPERLQAVPRMGILRVPKKFRNVSQENVSLRKSMFFRIGLSGILQVSELILIQRKRLMALSPNNMSVRDQNRGSEMLAKYKIAKEGASPTQENMRRLVRRMDALPPSMVIAQAAIESAWLQSRFARQGQALFGQWTTGKQGIKALRSDARLAAFANPRESLIAYMLNINTHPAYAGLRKARAQMRRKGQPLDGYALAGHLGRYAEIGQDYVKLIRRMIKRDQLNLADTAKLAPGPRILFRGIDQQGATTRANFQIRLASRSRG
jgi:Bax protein